MSSPVEIRALRPGEAVKVLPSLNEEFIFQRGRRLPLEKRYPGVFSPENAENCFAAVAENGEILSFAATEARELRKCALKVFFTGCVFTVPAARGTGLAGKVLSFAAETCRARGFAAGYLWTRLNAFYERFGWKTSDRSVLMTLRGVGGGDRKAALPFSGRDADVLARKHEALLIRRAEDYFKIPPPADEPVRLKTAGGGYLCGGIGQTAGYVYELCTENAEELGRLLSSFAGFCGANKAIWINLQPEQQREIALLEEQFPDAEITAPALQMNLIFAEEHRELLDSLNIPYLDRI